MGSAITTQPSSGRNARKPYRIVKPKAVTPTRPRFQLRRTDKFFWYSGFDDVIRLATSAGPVIVPEQNNTYDFNPLHFTHEPFPSTLPRGTTWPPKTLEDLVGVVGAAHSDCVGDRCYTDDVCNDPYCNHTFDNWREATAGWKEYVELRMTSTRGIGVFAKRAFRKGTVLGWYAGELKTLQQCGSSDYLMEMEIGAIAPQSSPRSSSATSRLGNPEASVFIDGERRGNWTRFINHSCDPHAIFRITRVGGVRIMVVEAVRDVDEGEELTVTYGDEYYRLYTKKICRCESWNCVGKKREIVENTRRNKVRVKKRKKVSPPRS